MADRPIIALDVGHRGKPDHPDDRGAVSPSGQTEVDLVWPYWAAIDEWLRLNGFAVLGPFDGPYRERVARAAAAGAVAFIQLHADAGGGSRGTAWHDYRSERGKALAKAIRGRAPSLEAWGMGVGAAHPDSDGVQGNEGERPFGILDLAWLCPRMCGLVLELGFVDGKPSHMAGWAWQAPCNIDIASGIASGIASWAKAAP